MTRASRETLKIERIKELIRLLTQESPDFLILYIHPNDVVVVPALCALPSKPPTIFFNHADHVFWLGRNIIDYLIEWREEGAKYSKKFRKILQGAWRSGIRLF